MSENLTEHAIRFTQRHPHVSESTCYCVPAEGLKCSPCYEAAAKELASLDG